MTSIKNTIKKDIESLTVELNSAVKKFIPKDPLVEVGFSSTVVKDDGKFLEIEITAHRNSGGSPESDHAVKDSVLISYRLEGPLTIRFNREMLEIETIRFESFSIDGWADLLGKIRESCSEHINLG